MQQTAAAIATTGAPTAAANVQRMPNSRTIKFVPLDEVKAPIIGTTQAAGYIGMTPWTLCDWARRGVGPVQAVKIGTKHWGWRVSDIRKLLQDRAA